MACEVLMPTPGVRNLIREGKTFQLPNTIRMHSQHGMELFDQALVSLYHRGVIKRDQLWDFGNDREEVARLTGENEIWQQTEKDPSLTTQFS